MNNILHGKGSSLCYFSVQSCFPWIFLGLGARRLQRPLLHFTFYFTSPQHTYFTAFHHSFPRSSTISISKINIYLRQMSETFWLLGFWFFFALFFNSLHPFDIKQKQQITHDCWRGDVPPWKPGWLSGSEPTQGENPPHKPHHLFPWHSGFFLAIPPLRDWSCLCLNSWWDKASTQLRRWWL